MAQVVVHGGGGNKCCERCGGGCCREKQQQPKAVGIHSFKTQLTPCTKAAMFNVLALWTG